MVPASKRPSLFPLPLPVFDKGDVPEQQYQHRKNLQDLGNIESHVLPVLGDGEIGRIEIISYNSVLVFGDQGKLLVYFLMNNRQEIGNKKGVHYIVSTYINIT